MKRSNQLALTILLSILTVVSGQSLAAEITLKAAINQGLEQNSEIRATRNTISSLERELALLSASQGWQVQAGASTTGMDSVDISVERSFGTGLTISPQLSWTLDKQNTAWSIKASQPLYPILPSNTAQQHFSTEKELLKAKAKLAELEAAKTLSWLQSYLNIQRIKEKKDIYLESVGKAEAQLAQVQKRRELGDVGKTEELTAKLSLQEAKYRVQDSEQQLGEVIMTLEQELGLGADQDLVFDESDKYLASLSDRMAKLPAQYSQKQVAELAAMAEEHSADLITNRIENEVLSQELEWLKRDGRTSLNLTASHESVTSESTVGFDLAYQLYDGGSHALQLEAKESAIADNQANFEDLQADLLLELTHLTNTIKLGRSALAKEELNREKAQHEAEVAEDQLRLGLIDYLEYQDYWITSKETIVNLESVQDQLLLDQLKLYASIGGLYGD